MVNRHTKREYCHLTAFFEGGGFMARIPDEEIERLKKEVPMERLVMASAST
jgi:hypothetical protein